MIQHIHKMSDDEAGYLAFPSIHASSSSVSCNVMTLPCILKCVMILVELLVLLLSCEFQKSTSWLSPPSFLIVLLVSSDQCPIIFFYDIIFIDSTSERKYGIYLYEYAWFHLKWLLWVCHFIFFFGAWETFSVSLLYILVVHAPIGGHQADCTEYWNKHGAHEARDSFGVSLVCVLMLKIILVYMWPQDYKLDTPIREISESHRSSTLVFLCP